MAGRKSAPPKSTAKSPSAKKKAAAPPPETPADQVDAQLARYRGMRDFHITAEPSGAGKPAAKAAAARTSMEHAKAGLPFVIQKHAASHLHYDFRLGWNGVLKSWAVAKGPSYYTGDRRLAVEVEDHPMEYGGFEGIIPKGQYGGGTVMIWDQGTWSPQPGHEDVDEGLRKGSLKFVMHGTKMHGKWTLVRMHSIAPRDGRWKSSSKPNWLLIKEHDEFERGPNDPTITEQAQNSAVTGRTMEQIAREEDHVWNSKGSGASRDWYRQESRAEPEDVQESSASASKVKGRSPSAEPLPSEGTSTRTLVSSSNIQTTLRKLPKERQPDFISPQLALETTGPPDTAGWLHELKLDGYRIQARKSGSKVQLLTRKGLDWTHRMTAIAADLARLPVGSATLDGEVVVLAEDGTTSFAELQASFQEGAKYPLTYFCFDLLHLEGHNPRDLPLQQRKELLHGLLGDGLGTLRYSEHIETGGEAMFRKACELHAEGIISKRASGKYSAGRGGDWLKSKCLHEQEFVISGYTPSTEGPGKIGSLLLGYYQGGKLIYAGRTGTGFTQKLKRSLKEQFSAIETRSTPFERPPVEARRDAVWVEPKYVAQVRFATWTADNLVRQAAFLGLREDKSATEVRREEPTVAPRPKAGSKPSSDDAGNEVESLTRANAHAPSSQRAAKVQTTAVPQTKPKASAKQITTSAPPVRLTHPNKVLDPETGLTKAQLAEYYWTVADRMLPHVAYRPLSLVRCPEGAGKPCFYQKHVNHMLPPGVHGVSVPDKKTGVPEPYITLNTAEALTGLAQMGVLEVHPWGSCNDDLEHPDRLIFDLDPDESLPWETLCGAAAEVRRRLKKAGLDSFLKTTGGKGLHVVAPFVATPEIDWTRIKNLAYLFVSKMERANPTLYLTKMTKSARVGKIYLDYLRNERGATAVAPFSPRARPGAHVSLPLPWSALKLPERPVFPVAGFAEWRSRLRSDPWKDMVTLRQELLPENFEAL